MALDFTWFDAIVASTLLASALLGYRTGFLLELVPTLGLLGAIAIAILFADDLQALTGTVANMGSPFLTLMIGLLVFFVLFVAFALLTSRLELPSLDNRIVQAVDRIAGVGLGLARGVFVAALVVLEVNAVSADRNLSRRLPIPDAVPNAACYPALDRVANTLLDISKPLWKKGGPSSEG